MTHAYLACLAGPERPEPVPPTLLAALARLGCVRRPGPERVRLFATDDLPARSAASGEGLVIGHLFDRSGNPAGPDVPLTLSRDGVRAMTRRLWGSYVAIGVHGERILAARDPSGGLACYHTQIGGVTYFTSVPHLLVECGLLAAELDWAQVVRALVHHSERKAETAIQGIRELLPGTLVTVDGHRSETCPVWDPWDHASASPPNDPAETLRQTLLSTLAAWGHSFDRPLVEISGGLDSAIVAAGLAPATRSASLITFAAAPGDPDETAYARALAGHLGLPLEVATPRAEHVDLARSLSSDHPRPNARAFTQAADAESLRHARAIGANAFVSGGGGDDVFCYLRTVLPAVDRFRAQGLGPMLSTAMDIAVMNHSTLWDALARVVRRLVRRGPARRPLDLRFIAPGIGDAVAAASDRRPDDRPPGKAAHVRGVMTIHNYLEGHARAAFAPILSPLLSQPVVECCLAIPSWHWCAGGRNRAVAREAVRGLLPPVVLERRSKGCFDGFCAALLETNRALVGAMLLDGRLAAHGLLDREAVERALTDPALPAESVARLLALVDVESWVAGWAARPAQRS